MRFCWSKMWSVVFLVLASAVCVHLEEPQVCYDHVGCFDNSPPFNNTVAGYLPKSPEELDVKFKLFTPQNPATAYFMNYTDVNSIRISYFDPKLPLKVIIHGFMSTAKGNWVTKMKDEILKKEKANVVDIDWSKGAGTILYEQAVANVRLVGVQIKIMLEIMADNLGMPLENVHIIGHSLGAHMAGYIGFLLDSKIGRISALDAAELDYSGFPLPVRVDSSDAIFVDAIHTDSGPYTPLGSSGGLGMIEAFGHVDFYVNGGVKQPGCKTALEVIWENIFGRRKRGLAQTFACNHVRSHEIFTESVNSPCIYTSYPCQDYETFQRGECTSCGDKGCGTLGYSAAPSGGHGEQYLLTLDKAPYCGYQYKVVVTVQSTEQAKSLGGELQISFTDKDGVLTSQGTIKSSDAKMDESTYQGVVIVDKQFEDIKSVVAHFKAKESYMRVSFVIKNIEVTSLSTNDKHSSMPGSYSSGGKISVTIPMET